MTSLSRRQVLYDLGILSATGIAAPLIHAESGLSLLPTASSSAGSKDFYLVVSGSWIISMEKNGIQLITPDCVDHTYDYSLNPAPRSLQEPIVPGSYSLQFNQPNSSKPSNLVDSMVKNKQGFIFNKNVTLDKDQLNDPEQTPNLRTIQLPYPTSILPAAILTGPTIQVDAKNTYSGTVGSWPSSYIFVYSGNWNSVTFTDPAGIKTNIYQGKRAHLRLRVCRTDHCEPSEDPAFDCKEVKEEENHVHTVFHQLLSKLQFAPGTFEPAISFPGCSCDNSYLNVAKGANSDIDEGEIGMPIPSKNATLTQSLVFAHLHNCAASGVIVGATH